MPASSRSGMSRRNLPVKLGGRLGILGILGLGFIGFKGLGFRFRV